MSETRRTEANIENQCREAINDIFPDNTLQCPAIGTYNSDGSDFAEFVFSAEHLEGIKPQFVKFLEAMKTVVAARWVVDLGDMLNPRGVRCEVRVPPEVCKIKKGDELFYRLYFRAAFFVTRKAPVGEVSNV